MSRITRLLGVQRCHRHPPDRGAGHQRGRHPQRSWRAVLDRPHRRQRRPAGHLPRHLRDRQPRLVRDRRGARRHGHRHAAGRLPAPERRPHARVDRPQRRQRRLRRQLCRVLGRRHQGLHLHDGEARGCRHRQPERRLPGFRRCHDAAIDRPQRWQRDPGTHSSPAHRPTARTCSSRPPSRWSQPTATPRPTSTTAPAARRFTSRPAQ